MQLLFITATNGADVLKYNPTSAIKWQETPERGYNYLKAIDALKDFQQAIDDLKQQLSNVDGWQVQIELWFYSSKANTSTIHIVSKIEL